MRRGAPSVAVSRRHSATRASAAWNLGRGQRRLVEPEAVQDLGLAQARARRHGGDRGRRQRALPLRRQRRPRRGANDSVRRHAPALELLDGHARARADQPVHGEPGSTLARRIDWTQRTKSGLERIVVGSAGGETAIAVLLRRSDPATQRPARVVPVRRPRRCQHGAGSAATLGARQAGAGQRASDRSWASRSAASAMLSAAVAIQSASGCADACAACRHRRSRSGCTSRRRTICRASAATLAAARRRRAAGAARCDSSAASRRGSATDPAAASG